MKPSRYYFEQWGKNQVNYLGVVDEIGVLVRQKGASSKDNGHISKYSSKYPAFVLS